MTTMLARRGVLLTVIIAVSGCAASDPAATTKPTPSAVPVTRPSAVSGPALEVTEQVLTDDGVLVAKLSNGLTAIIKEHRAAPVVSVRCYVHAGGLYEGPWLGAGISHLVEHLVAQDVEEGKATGAAKPASPVSRIGGQYNASTSDYMTDYYISADASKMMDCIDLVAGWMAKPQITLEDFNREHGVVQRELEMGKDSPIRQLYYAHDANVYRNHPAAVPVIGYAEPLSKLTYQDVLAYHGKMYVPQNMIFCVVGDVDAQAALKRICQAFAPLERGRAVEYTLPAVEPVATPRKVVKPMRDLKEAMEQMSFLTIPLVHEDLYALDLLSTVLGEGASSRLERVLVREKQLATAISTGSDTPPWGRGHFMISFRSAPDKADKVEQAVQEVLADVIENGVQGDEIERAKRQKLADLVRQRQSVDAIAGLLATDYLCTGDVSFSRDYVKRIQAVTGEQLQKIARKYFLMDRLVMTRLVPSETFRIAAAATQAAQAPAGEMFTMPNGLRVVLKPVPNVGMVSMAFVTRGGLMLEMPKDNGLGSLMADLATRGAGTRTAEQIDAFFDQAGGGLEATCGNNNFIWQVTVLDDSFQGTLEILSDVIVRPRFETKELEILKPIAAANIDAVDQQWESQLMKYFRKEFFTNSPYGMLSSGSKDVVKAATVEQIAEYHRQHVKAGDSVLAIVGQFDPAQARATIESMLKDLPAGTTAIDVPGPRRVPLAGETHVLKTRNKVAGIVLAVPGMTMNDLADRFPIDVLDTIISGWQLPSGWLHEELRGKQLVYVVHAYNWPGIAPGAFVTYAACQPDKAQEVVGIIEKDLNKASRYRPEMPDIQQAVNTILTAEHLSSQSMAAQAMMAGISEANGLGWDFQFRLGEYYGKVTPEDVFRVGQKYLGGGKVVIVTTPAPQMIETGLSGVATQPAGK